MKIQLQLKYSIESNKFLFLEQTLVKGKVIGSMYTINEQWKLSVEVMVKAKAKQWLNVVSVTNGKKSGLGELLNCLAELLLRYRINII